MIKITVVIKWVLNSQSSILWYCKHSQYYVGMSRCRGCVTLHCACIVSLLCATYKGGEQKLDALASAVSLDLYYSKSECEKALHRSSVKLRSIMVLMKSSYRVLVMALCSNAILHSYLMCPKLWCYELHNENLTFTLLLF